MDPELAPEILAYYERAAESERLETGVSQLELLRTQEVIRRWIGPPPLVVLDVGGGPGRYAVWLAALGYEVHLVDPVPRLVEQARRLGDRERARIATCAVGDARAVRRDDRSVDVVLLLGPLYHLVAPDERLRALQEACRVLRPGGLLFAAAISRFASALDGLARDRLADAAFQRIVEQDLAAGVHENPTGRLDYFTTAYFHRPEELEAEVAAAGFAHVEVVGLEGPGWLFADFDARWRDPRRREDLLHVARALEGERSVRAMSAHLLAVARRADEERMPGVSG